MEMEKLKNHGCQCWFQIAVVIIVHISFEFFHEVFFFLIFMVATLCFVMQIVNMLPTNLHILAKEHKKMAECEDQNCSSYYLCRTSASSQLHLNPFFMSGSKETSQ